MAYNKIISPTKLKLLYLARIFYELTDEEHALTVYELAERLEKYGISGTRKTISEDIDLLEMFGMDIVSVPRGRMIAYYLASRQFEHTELKILADAVCASRFVTEKKSRQLLKKIESLAGVYQGKDINRQVYISNRIKSDNESIYINADTIHRAINEGRMISFRYFDYSTDKQKKFREGVKKCSPYALTFNDGNYYLVAFYEKYSHSLSNFRVDRMREVAMLEEKAVPISEDFDLAEYMNASFSMFSGESVSVKLRFSNDLINPIIDRFGTDVFIIPDDDGHFTVKADIRPGAPFYGWLFQFGKSAQIISPPEIKEEFMKMLFEVKEIQ